MSRVLIVGGAGYAGGALTDILVDSDIIVYDSLVFEEAYQKNVAFARGDIRDRSKLKVYLEWADCVVWLAALVGDGACAINPNLSVEVNQKSVKWLSENFDGRIIFTSTCSVYGASEGILSEDSKTNPLSVYASTKLKAESYLESKNAIILRLGTLFGLSDKFSRIRLDLVVNTMTARAVVEGNLKVYGGQQYRPLLHVKDVASFIAESISSESTGIYNLHKENMLMLDLAKTINKYISAEVEVVESLVEDDRNYQVSSQKAKAIGFDPQLSVDYGIVELANLLHDGRIKNPNNPRYSNEGFLNVV